MEGPGQQLRFVARCLALAVGLALCHSPAALGVSLTSTKTFQTIGPNQNDFLGNSIAVLGDHLVVGVPEDDIGEQDAGVAYFFYVFPIPSNGSLIRIYQPSNPQPGAKCGSAVAAVAGKVLVACPFDDTGATDAGVVYLFDPVSAEQLGVFTNPSPSNGDRFGTSIAAVGSNVLVGAPFDGGSGVAYLFDGDPGSPTFGDLLATFANPTPASNDRFGYSVSAVGSLALVGAPLDDGGGVDTGAAYLFDADPLSAGFGNLLATLTDPTPAILANFGFAVAAAGNKAVVGAPMDTSVAFSAGAVYLFDADPQSPTFGDHTLTLQKPTPVAGDQLGYSVTGIGGSVLAGALLDDTAATDAGAVYLFDGSSGALLDSFVSPSPQAFDNFGFSVAAISDQVFVAAPSDDATAVNQGILYQFEDAIPPVIAIKKTWSAHSAAAIAPVGANFILTGCSIGACLVDSTGKPLRVFFNPDLTGDLIDLGLNQLGGDVAVSGTNVLISAEFDGACCDSDGQRYGAAYLFDAGSSSSTFGKLLHTFHDPFPNPVFSGNFSWSLAAVGSSFFIGTPADDVAYVFDGDPGSPNFGDLIGALQQAGANWFGQSLAVWDTRVLVGSDGPFPFTGEGYLKDGDVNSLTFGDTLCTFVNPTPESSIDSFSFRVALNETRALIGNPGDLADSGFQQGGAAYLFDADLNSPAACSLLRTIVHPTPAAFQSFGWSVGLLGEDLLIGAAFEDQDGNNKGALFVFDDVNDISVRIANPDPGAIHFASELLVSGTSAFVSNTQKTHQYDATYACGDGFVDPGEQCDDGNTQGGDCCSATCGFEAQGSLCVINGNKCAICNGTGTCVADTAHCNDGDACTTDSCVPATGCQHTTAPNGTPCNDGNGCTTGEKCQAGVCGQGTCNTGSVCGSCGLVCINSGGSCLCG